MPDIKVWQFTLAASCAMAILGLSGLGHMVIAGIRFDTLIGFGILASLSGMSVYRNPIPGIIVGGVWGFVSGGITYIPITILTVIAAMYLYSMLCIAYPLSPLNVYKASAAGSLAHSIAVYATAQCDLAVLCLVELLVTMLIVKAVVNKMRSLKLINSEDPVLVAKIERDHIQFFYDQLNKVFNTNFQRPKRILREEQLNG